MTDRRCCLVEQVEGVETVVDVIGRIDQLGYGLGTGPHDVAMKSTNIPNGPLKSCADRMSRLLGQVERAAESPPHCPCERSWRTRNQ